MAQEQKSFRARNVPPEHPFRVKLNKFRQKHRLRTLSDALEKLAKEGWS